MKLLTKEEEDAHYSQVLKGGSIGTVLGLIGGYAGVMAASRRYHTIRNLTIPMKAFLVTSSGTFVGIIGADRSSRAFEASQNQSRQWYENREERLREEGLRGLSFSDRALAWAREERYTIVFSTWVASMIGSFAIVGRNPYLSGPQKLVQARVYAQGATLAVLIASAAFEISERRRVRKDLDAKKIAAGLPVDAEAPKGEEGGDLWKDMVAAEEQRLKKQHRSLYEKHHTDAGSDPESGSTSPQQKAGVEGVQSEQEQEQKGEEKKEKQK
ncbi:HIG1 domain-containing protein [Aspergillus mulundensis]|uniref:HIG1 domain-containing protein n=1 Tax=Aspergillus mulundensis TaxID=1810919 RepID=A0A3D8RRF6_9EURO|nr:hypothetical protein DSM5745_06631 [Aspergillus mulundensis]RDW76639.1 hypothetical protein DSM5745_06631 [Aspergillus mulundensis]